MKKALLTLWTFIIVGCFFVQPVGAFDQVKDQANDAAIGGGNMTLLTSSTTRAQTFMTNVVHLTQVDLYLKDRVQGPWIEIQLIRASTGGLVTTAGSRMGAGDGWQTISIQADLEIGAIYQIKAYNESPLDVKWTYNDTNPYSRGKLYYGSSSADESSDFNFRTWGYNDPVAAEETPDVNTDTTPATATPTAQAPATGTTPASTTTATIKNPTQLAAEYTDIDSSVNLTWTKSATDDIDGYKIFRSETKGEGYTEIGQSARSGLSYSDQSPIAGKTLYYIVRAYKGDQQSANSNEASSTIPEGAETIAAADQGSDESATLSGDNNSTKEDNTLYWVLGIAVAILIALLIYLVGKRIKKQKYGALT